MDALSKQVAVLGGEVAIMQQQQQQQQGQIAVQGGQIAQLLAKIERGIEHGPYELPLYLREWWSKNIGRLKTSVKCEDFFQRVMEWLESIG